MSSRIAKQPIQIPAGVDVTLNGQDVSIKGAKDTLTARIHERVVVSKEENVLRVSLKDTSQEANAQAGTARMNLANMVEGVSRGFEKKLLLKGVGYRAQLKGRELHLSLGFSHPVVYTAPDGITLEAPSPTEIIVKGACKQKVGQVAANIRAYRPPEPYKGKGVRYADEVVVMKETKKK